MRLPSCHPNSNSSPALTLCERLSCPAPPPARCCLPQVSTPAVDTAPLNVCYLSNRSDLQGFPRWCMWRMQLLSSMQLAPGECLQRCAVTAASGERMVLLFRLHLEERHQPSYRYAPGRRAACTAPWLAHWTRTALKFSPGVRGAGHPQVDWCPAQGLHDRGVLGAAQHSWGAGSRRG
jgi:hypothetical protein